MSSGMADEQVSRTTEGRDETKHLTSEDVAVTISSNSFQEIIRHFDSKGNLINKATKIAIPCAICQLENLALYNYHLDKPLDKQDEPYVVLPCCGHVFGCFCLAEWYRMAGKTCPCCRVAMDFEGGKKAIFIVNGSKKDGETQRQEIKQARRLMELPVLKRAEMVYELARPQRHRETGIHYPVPPPPPGSPEAPPPRSSRRLVNSAPPPPRSSRRLINTAPPPIPPRSSSLRRPAAADAAGWRRGGSEIRNRPASTPRDYQGVTRFSRGSQSPSHTRREEGDEVAQLSSLVQRYQAILEQVNQALTDLQNANRRGSA